MMQIYGDFTILSPEHEQVFAYTRALGTSTAFVLLNFQEKDVSFSLPREDWTTYQFVLGNYRDPSMLAGMGSSSQRVLLKGYEGRVSVRS